MHRSETVHLRTDFIPCVARVLFSRRANQTTRESARRIPPAIASGESAGAALTSLLPMQYAESIRNCQFPQTLPRTKAAPALQLRRIGYIPACDNLDLKPKIRGSWSRRRRSMDGPQKWPKSSVIRILTINSLTLRILQTLFAQPAPVKRFRRVGGAGTPSSREFVLPTLRNETPPKLGFGRPATNFFRETSTGHS